VAGGGVAGQVGGGDVEFDEVIHPG
jgi:hypothetical protein